MKSNVIPKPIEDQIRKTLTAIFNRELAGHSEQFIQAHVNREIRKIKEARTASANHAEPIQRHITENVVVPLYQLGAENIALLIFETENGLLFELHFEVITKPVTSYRSEYEKYRDSFENGRYYPDPRD